MLHIKFVHLYQDLQCKIPAPGKIFMFFGESTVCSRK